MLLLKAALVALHDLLTPIRCNLLSITYSMFFNLCKNSDQKPSYDSVNLDVNCWEWRAQRANIRYTRYHGDILIVRQHAREDYFVYTA